MTEPRFTILHPVTGDRAEADDIESARVAARTLRNDAVNFGASPRVRSIIVRHPQKGGAADGKLG